MAKAGPTGSSSKRAKAKKAPKRGSARNGSSATVEAVEVAAPRGGRDDRTVMCRSCGKRPGKPTAILGQMMQAELCAECTALRKERIRMNRAAARALRHGAIH
jgi:hypothetical protein